MLSEKQRDEGRTSIILSAFRFKKKCVVKFILVKIVFPKEKFPILMVSEYNILIKYCSRLLSFM